VSFRLRAVSLTNTWIRADVLKRRHFGIQWKALRVMDRGAWGIWWWVTATKECKIQAVERSKDAVLCWIWLGWKTLDEWWCRSRKTETGHGLSLGRERLWVGILKGCYIHFDLIDWLIDWLTDWLIDWSSRIGWLDGEGFWKKFCVRSCRLTIELRMWYVNSDHKRVRDEADTTGMEGKKGTVRNHRFSIE